MPTPPSILIGHLCGALAALVVSIPSLKLSWNYLDGRERGETIGDALFGLIVNGVGTLVFTVLACTAAWIFVSIFVNKLVDSRNDSTSNPVDSGPQRATD